jgi:hypothetical protein
LIAQRRKIDPKCQNFPAAKLPALQSGVNQKAQFCSQLIRKVRYVKNPQLATICVPKQISDNYNFSFKNIRKATKNHNNTTLLLNRTGSQAIRI